MRAFDSAALPPTAYVWAVVAVAAAMATSNPLLTAACMLVLLIIAQMLWRPGEPPILLFVAGYQWMQVATLVFLADYQSKSVSSMSFSANVETAIWLGLLGLVVLSIGMRFGVRKLGGARPAVTDPELDALSVERLFLLYAIFAVIAAATPYIMWRVLPLASVLGAIANLKWVFYMLVGYVTLRRRRKRGYFVVATLLEFILGIGFFSGFKTVFFVCGLLIMSIQMRVNLRMIVATVAVIAAIFISGAAWMTIREDYRSFLNQGTGQQVVLVSPVQQVKEFGSLVSDVDEEDLRSSAQEMFRRLAYVDYFAAVLDYVPKQRPFEGGRLLWRAIRHMLIPRFLDPDKPVLESDSEITMRYTGLTVASDEQGTSIGIGYMAEGYVDFGIVGMLVLVFVFGTIWGKMYAWLVSHSRITATGLAFGTALLVDMSSFEIAEIKLLGGLVARFLIFAVVMRYVMPSVHRWLMVRSGEALSENVPSEGMLTRPGVVGLSTQ